QVLSRGLVTSLTELLSHIFFFQAEDGIRDFHVTGVQTCALPIWARGPASRTQDPGPGPAGPNPTGRPATPKETATPDRAPDAPGGGLARTDQPAAYTAASTRGRARRRGRRGPRRRRPRNTCEPVKPAVPRTRPPNRAARVAGRAALGPGGEQPRRGGPRRVGRSRGDSSP